MTPKEKAQELLNKFFRSIIGYGPRERETAKQSALLAVDEIIQAHIHGEGIRHLKWWQEVKQELLKL